MDIRMMSRLLFVIILMQILWSQTEAKLSFPDCHSLSHDFVKLWKSNEKTIKKYQSKWDRFIFSAWLNFDSEISSLDWDCYIRTSEEIKAREKDVKRSRKELKPIGDWTGMSTKIKKHIRSSKMEDQIGLAKIVEQKCDEEVSKQWNVLLSFEKTLLYRCVETKTMPPTYFYGNVNWSNFEFAFDNFNVSGDDILQETVDIYQKLIDYIGNGDIKNAIKELDKKSTAMKKKGLKKPNDKVFVRSVRRMKRFEQNLRKRLVPLKIGLLCQKEPIYYKIQIKEFVRSAIEGFNSDIYRDAQVIQKWVAALKYQMNFV